MLSKYCLILLKFKEDNNKLSLNMAKLFQNYWQLLLEIHNISMEWNHSCILGGTIQNSCLAKFKARICQPIWAIHSQVQASTSVRMHSIKAFVMPHHIVTLQNCSTKTWHHCINWSVQHFWSFTYSARCSAIWRRKAKAPYCAAKSRHWYLGRFRW